MRSCTRIRRSQERGKAVRTLLRGRAGRLHADHARKPAGVSSASCDRLARVCRRPARSVGPRRRYCRHSAGVAERILVTGDKTEVFNGICGAESGSVPVSASAPAMLFSEMEVQKQAHSRERPPILPPPGFEQGGAPVKAGRGREVRDEARNLFFVFGRRGASWRRCIRKRGLCASECRRCERCEFGRGSFFSGGEGHAGRARSLEETSFGWKISRGLTTSSIG